MNTETRNLFQCPVGHQQYLPYKAGPIRSWCEDCGAMALCSHVPPGTMQRLDSNVDTMRVIREKFLAMGKTHDDARQHQRVHLVPDPKTDADRALVDFLASSRFPARHIATLPHMDADGLAVAQRVMAAFQGPGPSCVILWGDYGTGKTQAATAVAKLRRLKGAATRYASAPAILRGIKDNWHTRVAEEDLLRRYHEAAGLVIDEIQAALDENPDNASWARTQIQGILDVRYSSRRPLKTILIANSPDAETLNRRLGGHIISRVLECGKIMEVCRRNYRIKQESPEPNLKTQ